MRFDIHGPFWIERRNGIIASTATDRREYWEWVDGYVPGLSGACGCYIFTINAGRGRLPWYVGKAERQTFKNECYSAHKIINYTTAIAGRKGTPELFFIPQLTRKGGFRKPTQGQNGRKAIVALESLLIGMALSKNPELQNIKGTRMFRDLEVAGLINSNKKKNAHDAKMLREAMRRSGILLSE